MPDKDRAPTTQERQLRWNLAHLKRSYANITSANSTREEVVLSFGVNTSWDRVTPEVEFEMSHRIIMSPHSAKRLAEVLAKLVDDYEARHGALS